MRGLSAAACVTLLGACLLAAGCGARAAIKHTCSATDRQFISTAQLNMTALNLWGQEYLRGDAAPREVVSEARQAARVVSSTRPSDPSLERTKLLMNAMFKEYATAIVAKTKNRDPGRHIYRAYGLANFAHDVLAEAQPQLHEAGCDVSPLL
jgi:hypothetical protein